MNMFLFEKHKRNYHRSYRQMGHKSRFFNSQFRDLFLKESRGPDVKTPIHIYICIVQRYINHLNYLTHSYTMYSHGHQA